MSMKVYSPDSKKIKLIEMAQLDDSPHLHFQVYTDHTPPHFHVIKDKIYEARIVIPKEIPENISMFEILSYKFQKSGKDVVTTYDLKEILHWMKKPSKVMHKKMSNHESIIIQWEILNPLSKKI